MIPRSVATPYRLTSHLPNSVAPPPTSGLSKSTIAQLIETGPQRAFELLVEQQSVNVAELGFENGQNCLHLAIAAGHTGVAYYLLKQAPDCTEKLVNGTDFNGNTPLMYAVTNPLHTPADLIDKLIAAGARDELHEALARSVMLVGHTAISERLIANGANAAAALAWLCSAEDLFRENVCEAVEYLLSRGADPQSVFDYAIERDLWRAILELTLLGYSASDQLIKAAQRADRVTSAYLVSGGVDTVPVLMHLATLPESQASGTSVTSFVPSNPLSMINLIIQELKIPPTGPKLALFKLARHEDLTPLRRLAETVVCGPLTLCELSKYRAEALKILHDVGLVPPHALEWLVRDGNLAQAQKLVMAGVSTDELMHKLEHEAYAEESWQQRASAAAMMLLLAAGAKPHKLRPETSAMVKLHRQRVLSAAATPGRLKETLRAAALQGKVCDLHVLLSRAESRSTARDVMKDLVAEGRIAAASMFVKSGLEVGKIIPQTILGCSDTATAHAMIIAADAVTYPDAVMLERLSGDFGRYSHATLALLELLKMEHRQWGRQVIPALTDGAWAVVECASTDTEESRQRVGQLRDMKADLCAAVFLAFRVVQYETAVRLIRWEPQIVHDALMRTFIDLEADPCARELAQSALLLAGATYTSALCEAAKAVQPEAAKRLLRHHRAAGPNLIRKLCEEPPNEPNRAICRFLLDVGADPQAVSKRLMVAVHEPGNRQRLKNLTGLLVRDPKYVSKASFFLD
ncbi:ankyrin repeat domain-containing protein [Bordetella sp. 02P26C-1]|uniref:ankyrin repeat domain-containing protein n=1 Tax=Bordetella sp. 02P26C-1 TaxID=2683195 RepID=UPI001354B4AA|nr:ankyrin repeat domain-containing protein [Bordetella sp. 02P26C-1]MVW77676.1 hypothetical protein [Bordetella sp. 02P26C-1]